MCTGFWVGLFLWFVKDHTGLFTFDDSYVTALLCGFAASGAAYVPSVLFGDDGLVLERRLNVKKEKR